MKPYPLASLNHFTFPLITIRLLQSLLLGPPPNAGCLPDRRVGPRRNDPRPGNCQAGFLRFVQRAIQLAIAQEAAYVAPGFRIGNQLDKSIGIRGARAIEPAAHWRRTGIICRDRGVHAPESLDQLREMRGTKVQVEIGDSNPLRIKRDVEATGHERGRARQQLRQPARARGRERLDVEHTLLTDECRKEQRVDAEFLRLRLDRRAVGPRENRAQHSRVAWREEGGLPTEPDAGGAVAAQAQSLAPPEERSDVGWGVRQHDADFSLRFAVEPGEEQCVDARETGRDLRRGRRRRGPPYRRRKGEGRKAGFAPGAHSVVAEGVLARQGEPDTPRLRRVAACVRHLAEPESGGGALRARSVDLRLVQ